MNQNSPKTNSLMMSLANPPPQPKNFFLVRTRKLVELFEPLNSSLVQSAEELWCW